MADLDLYGALDVWQKFGLAGYVVSVSYGYNHNDQEYYYSVDCLAPNGEMFKRPYGAYSLTQCMEIMLNEAKERGWKIPI